MEVKIYREPENEILIQDETALEEYKELADELGLSFQQPENSKVPSVYYPLNDFEQKCMQALCPRISEVLEYTKSTIPLEVLKVYKYCKDNEMFEGYQVWHNYQDPDPLLIGWNYASDNARKNQYNWEKNRFLIARWGAEAQEVKVLVEMAVQKIAEQLVSQAKAAQTTFKEIINDPNHYAVKALNGETVLKSRELKLDIDSSLY